MHEYSSLGHMKQVNVENDIDNSNLSNFYLPHHYVLKPDSETILRVVFDGSCKSTPGVSVNDILMTGPVIQQELFSILLRFRSFKFVFTADITKIYRQVLIDRAQTSFQGILWRNNLRDEVRTYELLTLTYGTSSAPYLATRSLKVLTELHTQKYPIGAIHVIRDFYVDNLLTGANTIQQAIKVRDEIIKILAKGCFHLSK